jgi:hypothetical protein
MSVFTIVAVHIHTHIVAALTQRPETQTFNQLNLTCCQLTSCMYKLAKYIIVIMTAMFIV